MLKASFASSFQRLHRYALRRIRAHRNSQRPIEDIFSEIYRDGHWGTGGNFDSGSGSKTGLVVDSYIAAIARIAIDEGFSDLTFVDLGCGDFRVGRRLAPYCRTYIGVDVVANLIERNQREFSSGSVRFERIDIVSDPLPPGDVCFVRQVFQHLSNGQILQVLPKLLQYRWVFITEHQPSPGRTVAPNRDKVAGADIRLYDGSGVYLDQPPFNLPPSAFKEILAIASDSMGPGVDPGIIRTVLFEPGKCRATGV